MQTSTDQREPQALKARCVFPVAGEPIHGGIVTIQGERIVGVGEDTPAREARDLGNVAILPGLVNSHTHLEFSNLGAPLGEPGMHFTEWIGQIVRFRHSGDYRPREAVRIGLQQSLALGTTTLGEIAQPGWQPDLFESGGPDTTVFLELISRDSEPPAQTLQRARRHVESPGASPGWRPALSPHAPYSVHPEAVAQIVALSASERLPVAMHLAESLAEIELLQSAAGPFRDLLQQYGAWDATVFRPGRRPLGYLRELAGADRCLAIHGNYLDDEEITFLAEHADRMSVVYCPRTHAYFEHPEYPLRRLLAAGATVALGTDSRASSPDLSILAEMRAVARGFESVGRDAVLRMGTISGARALGLEREVGSLEPGKRADLAVVALPDCDAADPHGLLLESDLPVVATWWRGRMIDE